MFTRIITLNGCQNVVPNVMIVINRICVELVLNQLDLRPAEDQKNPNKTKHAGMRQYMLSMAFFLYFLDFFCGSLTGVVVRNLVLLDFFGIKTVGKC